MTEKRQMDKQFDQLFNQKCSWSYRSEGVIRKDIMERSANSTEVQSSFITTIENTTEGIINDKVQEKMDEKNRLNLSNNFYLQNDESRDIQCETSKFHEEIEVLGMGSNSQYTGKVLEIDKKQNLKNTVEIESNTSVSSTSSNEEVLQTRLSINNKNIICEENHSDKSNPVSPERKSNNNYAAEHNSKTSNVTFSVNNILYEENCNDNALVSQEKILDEENITPVNTSSESNPVNICPIIVQARACDKVNIDKNMKLNSETEKLEVNFDKEKIKKDIAIVKNGIEVGNNNMQQLVENNDQFNYSKRNSKNREEMLNNIIEKMTAVSEDNSTNTKHAKSKNIPSGDVIEEFFNGSLDLNLYKSNSLYSDKKNMSSNKQYEKNRQAALLNTNGDIFEHNTSSREISNSVDLFDISASDILDKSLKRQTAKGLKRNTKRAQTQNKIIKNMNIPSKEMEISPKVKNKSTNIRQQMKGLNKKLFNNDGKVLNKFHKQCNKSKISTSTPKEITFKGDKEINALFNVNSPIHNSRRNKRNSSIIATRKIEQIKEFENSTHIEEICLDSDEGTSVTPILKNMNNTRKLNFKSRNKYKYEAKNVLNSDNFNYKNITSDEDNSNEILCLFYGNKNEKKDLSCGIHDSSSLKWKNNEQVAYKYLTPDFNLCNENHIRDDKPHTSKKISRKEHRKNSDDMQSEISNFCNNTINKNELRERKMHNIDNYKRCMTRKRRKTWDMLEKELLGESNEETNANKTRVLEIKESDKRQNLPGNNDLCMNMKTTKVNTYNTQYHTKNVSKYLGTAVKSHGYLNNFNKAQSKETMLSYAKSKDIVEKSIRAMEKCTSQFNVPQEISSEDLSNYSKTSHEAMFHSNVTFIKEDKKKHYRNEIHYLRKRVKVNQNINSTKNKRKKFDNSENLDESSSEIKSFSFKNFIKEKAVEMNQDGASREKCSNPWNKLMAELNLENESECLKKLSTGEENTAVVISKPLSRRNDSSVRLISKHQKRKQKVINIEDEQINEQVKRNDADNKQESIILMEKEKESMKGDTSKSKKVLINSFFTADTESRSHDSKKASKQEDENMVKQQNKNVRGIKKMQIKKSPKFKLQLANNGNLKVDQNNDSAINEREIFDNAEHLDENCSNIKSYSFKNLVKEKTHESNGGVVSIPGVKCNNPWNKLMTELCLENKNLKKLSAGEENITEMISKPLTRKKNLNERLTSTHQERTHEVINIEDKQINGQVQEDSLENDTHQSRKFLSNSFLTDETESRSHDSKKISKHEDDSVVKKQNRYVRGAIKMQMTKKPPKFKLQIANNGSIKLKNTSESSSVSNSSREFTLSKQKSIKNSRNEFTDVARKKYKEYLKTLFQKKDPILQKTEDNKTMDQNKNQIKLLAEKDDDVFSLSSSDSESFNEIKPGSGALCDLFDE